MKKIVLLMLIVIGFTSCNPSLHVHAVGMRHHNLSHNKYRPGKYKKPVRTKIPQCRACWWLLRNR